MLIVMGYGGPLNEFFLQLCDDGLSANADEPAYSSLHEPTGDWRDIATMVRRLGDLGIPKLDDRRCRRRQRPTRNRIVQRALDGGVTELPD